MEFMASTTQSRPPSPELIFDTLNAYQKTAALRGAIELDLFTAIGEGPMAPEHAIWVEFVRAMVAMMAMRAEFIAGVVGSESGAKWKVLDIAAGHGIFGITIARRNPNAIIVALDWPKVLEVATENA